MGDVFSMVGGLGGDFYQDIEPKLIEMHSGSVLSGWMQEMRIPTLKYRFYLCVGWGTCTYNRPPKCCFSLCLGLGKFACGGSKIMFFRSLEALEGTFIRVHLRQSCLGCILEVFCVVWKQEMGIMTA